jgi:hypothetical protein
LALASTLFWKHKKSRFAIATITVLGLGVLSLVLGIWAIWSEVDFPKGPPLALPKKLACRKVIGRRSKDGELSPIYV